MKQTGPKYVVGLPDTQGGVAWLAGFDSDPTRYYTESAALRFDSIKLAKKAIVKAKATHPTRQRKYIVIQMDAMNKNSLE